MSIETMKMIAQCTKGTKINSLPFDWLWFSQINSSTFKHFCSQSGKKGANEHACCNHSRRLYFSYSCKNCTNNGSNTIGEDYYGCEHGKGLNINVMIDHNSSDLAMFDTKDSLFHKFALLHIPKTMWLLQGVAYLQQYSCGLNE